MKLIVTRREIGEITVTDTDVHVALQLTVNHGRAIKRDTDVVIEHEVAIAALLPGDADTGVADAISIAVAGVNKRADETVEALKGLTEL